MARFQQTQLWQQSLPSQELERFNPSTEVTSSDLLRAGLRTRSGVQAATLNTGNGSETALYAVERDGLNTSRQMLSAWYRNESSTW